MNHKSNFKTYILPLLMVFFLLTIWVSSGYLKMSQGIIKKMLAKELPLVNNPVIRGGEVCALLECPIRNTLNVFPKNNEIFIKQEYFDVMSYSVHNPIKFTTDSENWNIDLELLDLPLDSTTPTGLMLIKGAIYIDINDGLADGSPKNYYDEKIKFDTSVFKWDYYVEFDAYHKEGKLHSYLTKKEYPVVITISKQDSYIRLGLPIVEKIKSKMDRTYVGSHFAYTSLYNVYNKNGFCKLDNSDYIDCTPYSIDKDSNLIPIALIDCDKTKKPLFTENDLDKLKQFSTSNIPSTYTSEIANKIQKGIDLLDEGKYQDAEKIFLQYKDNPTCLSYLALSTWAKADAAKSMSKKMKLVKESFRIIENAMSMKLNSNYDRYTILYNQATLYSNTPDNVFHKADEALVCFNKLLLMGLNNKDQAKIFIKKRRILRKKNMTRELKLFDNELKIFMSKL
jgi:hypothetical protein